MDTRTIINKLNCDGKAVGEHEYQQLCENDMKKKVRRMMVRRLSGFESLDCSVLPLLFSLLAQAVPDVMAFLGVLSAALASQDDAKVDEHYLQEKKDVTVEKDPEFIVVCMALVMMMAVLMMRPGGSGVRPRPPLSYNPFHRPQGSNIVDAPGGCLCCRTSRVGSQKGEPSMGFRACKGPLRFLPREDSKAKAAPCYAGDPPRQHCNGFRG